MADETLHTLSNVQNVDYHIMILLDKLESMRKETSTLRKGIRKFNMQHELRTLEFWRSIISESIASFFYVFIVCGAAAGTGVGSSVSTILFATALASGFSVAALTQCFLHVSGANINPAVTLAMAVSRKISPIRAAMYITAQCGGGIAGAALLYSVSSVPGYQSNLQTAITHSASLAAWERFGVELILTILIVLTYFVATSPNKRYLGFPALSIGAAYSACTFVSRPYLNPARSLGPSFVLNKWDNHWVYWFGPMMGGVISGILYEYIFNPDRLTKKQNDSSDQESTSINTDNDMDFDMELEKPNPMHPKFHGSNYNRATTTVVGPQPSCEPIYGGTRSMYCRSPPLTRANLHRSQSVYAKSNGAINREIARSGQLVPAQSLYPLRLSQPQQSAHAQNQNVQNQLQHRSESIYGIRNSFRQQSQPAPSQQDNRGIERNERSHEGHAFQPIYNSRSNPMHTDSIKFEQRDETRHKQSRPDSVYGTSQRHRGQSAHSDDSSYGSYQGCSLTPPNRGPNLQQPTYYTQNIPQMQHKGGQRSLEYTTKQSQISTNPNGASSAGSLGNYQIHPTRPN